MTPQTTDPTLWKYPALYSPNRRIHIDNLEREVATLTARVEELMEGGKFIATLKDDLGKAQSELHTLAWKNAHAESQLEEARWLLTNLAEGNWYKEGWLQRHTAWLSAHTPTGKEK